MKVQDFIKKLMDIAKNYKTAYMWGGIGGPVTGPYIDGRAKDYPYIYSSAYVMWLRSLIGRDYFGIDCIGLIKAVLWGWNGNRNHMYGGANYTSNGVPDIGSEGMRLQLGKRTTDFSKIKPGHAVWMPGHIGVYVGDGLVVEATPAFKNGVQLTALANLGYKAGYPARAWREHGEIPYVDYSIDVITGGSSGGGVPERKYTVKSTDSDGYWGIAQRELGDPFRFEEILALSNRKATDVIRPGDVLILPASDPQPQSIVVGDKVRVRPGAKTYVGGGLASFVYDTTYTVMMVTGDRVVVGLNGVVTAAVKAIDLIEV